MTIALDVDKVTEWKPLSSPATIFPTVRISRRNGKKGAKLSTRTSVQDGRIVVYFSLPEVDPRQSRLRLTNRRISTLPRPAGAFDRYYDTVARNLVLQVNKGTLTWLVQTPDRRSFRKIGESPAMSIEEARKAAAVVARFV